MTKIIILAAGKGTRMKNDIPKVLTPLNGRPIIEYLLDSVFDSGVDNKPILVASPDNKEVLESALKNYDLNYVVQDKQLGTGHAVACAKDGLGSEIDRVMVLYGDHPFIKSESIKRFAQVNSSVMTVMPTDVESYSDWRQNFYHWGRFIRNDQGNIKKIVEFKDASEREKEMTEVNPGFMCFKKGWLLKNIDSLKNENKAQEYYLTDLVGLAFDQGEVIATVKIDPKEAIGVNSQEELKIAETLV